MTRHLTAPDAKIDVLVKGTPPGAMMFWAGTCADKKATCGACSHFGFRDDDGDSYPSHCALFFKHAHRPGSRLPPDTSACKYFSRKTQPLLSRVAQRDGHTGSRLRQKEHSPCIWDTMAK
jgi:hypothetical protein